MSLPQQNAEDAISARKIKITDPRVPQHLRDGLEWYVNEGCETGSFLRAVLSNDLVDAVTRADLESREALVGLVEYIVHNFPDASYGSRQRYEKWCKDKGLKGPL